MITPYDPPDLDAYNAKYVMHYRTEGYGFDGVTVRFPCPFCAEPDYMAGLLIGFEEWAQEEHTCSFCGRSGRIEITIRGSSTTARPIQTGGPPAPAYLPYFREEPQS